MDDGDVRLRIAADEFGGEFTLVGERDRDVARIFDDVGVGDDVALFGVDHNAGASRLKRPFACAGIGRDVEKSTEEGIFEQRVTRSLLAYRALDTNADDRGGDPANHRCE